MTRTRALLRLKTRGVPEASSEAPLEWLVTNGLGGYAAGAVDASPLRRFHGLLVAAHAAPIGRVMLLHALEDVVGAPDGESWSLQRGRPGAPRAATAEFWLQAGLPHWSFRVGDGITIERALMMPHGQNTVHVRYRLRGTQAVELRLRPFLDFRPHEGRLAERPPDDYRVIEAGSGQAACARAAIPIVLRLHARGGDTALAHDPVDWTGVPYAVERDRGYDCIGSMHAPLVFTIRLEPGRDVYFTASTESREELDALAPDRSFTLERTRRDRILGAAHPRLQARDTFLLPLAADQFIIRPAARVGDEAQAHAVGAEPRTVVAGYPWFTDWGRDTMISLEGLTLAAGRPAEARYILGTFALHVKDGLIPNLFPEGEREGLYHTADATLWFFHALHRYDVVTGDRSLVEELLPVLETIVQRHLEGTAFNIHVDADGLLVQGMDGYQLTWMDALVEGWVVTPRRGKAVEINALWYNALVLLAAWLTRAGRDAEAHGIEQDARRCREAFNARFWNPARRYLYDVVDGEHGDDDACRPNQVLAIAVDHPPLDRQYWEPVLETVAAELLTPLGLRTLSRRHPDYKARYVGDLRTRDAAYHQGTVWPWLMGPFLDAWLLAHPDDVEGARTRLAPLLQSLAGGCVGSISEICDAEAPFTPRGCFAQAWSVAELTRLVVKLADGGNGRSTRS